MVFLERAVVVLGQIFMVITTHIIWAEQLHTRLAIFLICHIHGVTEVVIPTTELPILQFHQMLILVVLVLEHNKAVG